MLEKDDFKEYEIEGIEKLKLLEEGSILFV